MVNLIWLLMLLAGIVVAALNGHIEIVTDASLEAAQTAVTLAFELIGLMAMWLGLLKIAEEAGLVALLSRLLRPCTRYLFPEIPRDHPAIGSIIMNMSANILGLGNAATPFGLKAMQELQTLNPRPEEATPAMCTFLGLNTGCITLIPATIIGIRAAADSTEPTIIVGPTILATGFSMVMAVVFDRVFRRFYGDNRR
ncbi:nucleoside recognition domain-containing protein [Neomoorella thermoacetica]|uniref:nucleoside recognition domain-containing protein n=1 Tax=Neomoorella thermoacetica TaxID=1525 RepID=UPI00069EF1B7|nr:nucleoside recognition domain-containing protein [Moorella thermoacetica]AKX94135.1 spore maturation protein A [Moorella thermoacetica]AKX96774.1 spore maturation protein A [Moorella thermoacetica]OIQ56503.1 spore maturation protein A [Moorella thermoacetica]OIQ57944.1 spore maturation protein A [Moorella thermoacetica]QDA00586.1 Spore maturation protein A [Moorella thermoacetica]